MKQILVTGCAGFIGSHLTERLLAEGHQVVGLDNFDAFYPRKIKENNLKKALNYSGFRFFEADLTENFALSDIFSSEHLPQVVIHLAAKAGVRPSIENPEGYLNHNVLATCNLLEWMRKKSVSKLIFASSSSVYGDATQVPYSESMDVSQPISPYALTKKSCELLNYTYHHLYEIDVLNLRLFTVYGPRQRPDLAIHKFTRLISEGKPISMYGDGSSSRDYTYIDDIVEGILCALSYICKHEKVYEILNLGNNKPMRLADLVQMIFAINQKTPHIKQLPMQPGDVKQTYADIRKAQRLLGFSPETPMEEGLRKFTDWYNKEKTAF